MENYFLAPASNQVIIIDDTKTKGRWYRSHPNLLGIFENYYDKIVNLKNNDHSSDL